MKKSISDTTRPVRVALYIRVSGEEQKIKGLSLEAQQERLEEYAKQHGWIIAGTFIDAAKTARKNMHKRTEFQRMMQLVKENSVDLLLFCRLDRWFRSVADYYKVMEVLEKHNCGWKTVDEEYDTTSANGRLYINVKLSIAQNEADICGERIDVVFDSKIAHGTVVSGSCPFGYKVVDKRLEVVPEKAAIVQDAFNKYEETVSQRGTIKYIRETYNVNWCEATFRRMLEEKLYTGVYIRGQRQNDNFCQAIVSREQFERVQVLLSKNARYAPSGRVYIFTSILVCNECNHKMVGLRTGNFFYYRCNQHFQRGRCLHKKEIREDCIEEWLFKNMKQEITRYKDEWEMSAAKKKKAAKQTDKSAVKRKMAKLKELYINDLIDIEEYKKDFEMYTTMLQQAQELTEETRPDFEAAERLLGKDFKEAYKALTREEKRTLWRSVISEIRIDADNNIVGILF